ncbi:hypothetical protein [Spiroplasma endosymbiont of Stenodema calcarata]|uniref:hypothetical protein n=1 Tax=Spiroplasma endosymbiont of Stenodema calcarata TaxID=3139328 RepID=UPI003CCAEF72
MNLFKFILLIIAFALFTYFFSSLNAYIEYLNSKNNNPTIKPSLIVERLLFWLQKDYIQGMGFFLLFPLIFSGFDLNFDCYSLVRGTLALKMGKAIKWKIYFKQLNKMKWDE